MHIEADYLCMHCEVIHENLTNKNIAGVSICQAF